MNNLHTHEGLEMLSEIFHYLSDETIERMLREYSYKKYANHIGYDADSFNWFNKRVNDILYGKDLFIGDLLEKGFLSKAERSLKCFIDDFEKLTGEKVGIR